MYEMTRRALSARVLHSKLIELDPPKAVTEAMTHWLRELEDALRNNKTIGFAEAVSVSDSAEISLINIRGPKQ